MIGIILLLLCVIVGSSLFLFLRSKREYEVDSMVDKLRLDRGIFMQYQASGLHTQGALLRLDMTQNVPRALWRIAEYVLKDFVEFWYVKVSENQDFPFEIREVFEHAFATLIVRASNVDGPNFVVKHIVSKLTTLMRLFRKCEDSLIKSNKDYKLMTKQEQLGLIESKLQREFTLHIAVTSGDPSAYLRKVSTALLSRILEDTDYNCSSVRTLLREIFTTFILTPVMGFAVPYWINVGGVNVFNAINEAKAKEAADKQKEKERKRANRKASVTRKAVSRQQQQQQQQQQQHEQQSEHRLPGLEEDAAEEDGDAALQPGESADSEPRRKQRAKSFLSHRVQQFNHQKQARGQLFPGDEDGETGGDANSDNSASTTMPVRSATVGSNLATSSSVLSGKDESDLTEYELGPEWDIRVESAVMKFDPKPYVSYNVNVQTNGYSWTIGKRYTRFTELHGALKETIRDFDARLPKKQWFSNFEQEFIQKRREQLQTYVDQLAWNRAVAESALFKAWLRPNDLSVVTSKGKNMNATLAASSPSKPKAENKTRTSDLSVYTSSALSARTTSEKPLTRANTSGDLTQLHTSGKQVRFAVQPDGQQNESKTTPLAASQQALNAALAADSDSDEDTGGFGSTESTSVFDWAASGSFPKASSFASMFDPFSGKDDEGEKKKKKLHARRQKERESALLSLKENARVMEPLHELLHEIFQLGSVNWVRTQSMWIINTLIKTMFDTALHSSVANQVEAYTSEKTIVGVIEWLTDLLWPNGTLFKPGTPPTQKEREAMRDACAVLFREGAAPSLSVLGSGYAEEACGKIFDFCQITCLVQHLSYSVLDALIIELFPELQAEIRQAAHVHAHATAE